MNFHFTVNPSVLNISSIGGFGPYFCFMVVNSDPKQILTLANSDFNPMRTLANSDPISEKSLANSDLDFAGSELNSGRGPN